MGNLPIAANDKLALALGLRNYSIRYPEPIIAPALKENWALYVAGDALCRVKPILSSCNPCGFSVSLSFLGDDDR
jgi:hypothetical protein